MRTGTVLLGVGAGCGCLTLIGAVLIVVLIIAVAPHGSPAPHGLQVEVVTVRVDQGGTPDPAAPTDMFRAGETVGAIARWVQVPEAVELQAVWVKIDNGRAVPVAEPRRQQIGPDARGKESRFSLSGAPPGAYAFLIFMGGGGGEARAVAIHKFSVQ